MINKLKFIFVTTLVAILVFSSVSICNASASSKCFGNGDISSAGDCVDYAMYGLQRLGYSPRYRSYGDIVYTDILSWLTNTGNGYAFYIQTHGNSSFFMDAYNNTLSPSEIAGGNWDLVFMDFSDSAATPAYADALHCRTYANRCFLGWEDEIFTTPSSLFNYYFWTQMVTCTPIAQAAIYASSSAYGSGETPIGFYGDATYYGYAR